MIAEAITAYFHYLGIMGLFVALAFEYVWVRNTMTVRQIKRVAKADLIYGLSSILVLATGLLRWFVLGKGSAFYSNNHIFLTKIGLFLVLGILSIKPTLKFLKWRKLTKLEPKEYYRFKEVNLLRKFIVAELILLFLIPLLATLMARGIGFSA